MRCACFPCTSSEIWTRQKMLLWTAFLSYQERIGHGEDILTPKHYLYQMVKNGSLDKAKYLGQTVQLTEASRTSEDFDDVSERSVREARLWKAIDNLPPVRREVLLMSKRDGMHNDEISQTLGISVKTVEAHLYKAYKTLRGKAKEIYLMIFF